MGLDGVCPLFDEFVDVHVVVGAAEVGDSSVVVVTEVGEWSGRDVSDEGRPVDPKSKWVHIHQMRQLELRRIRTV